MGSFSGSSSAAGGEPLASQSASYPRSQSVTNNICYILLHQINVRANFYVFKLVLVAIIRI